MTPAPVPAGDAPYPVRLEIDYPTVPRERVSVFFRLLAVIPIFIILMTLTGGFGGGGGGEEMRRDGGELRGMAATGGLVVVPTILMIVARRKYPRWWFEWNREVSRFSTRVTAYVALLSDEYPSTDAEQAVHLEIDEPNVEQLNQWLPLVKWFLAIPHYLALALAAIVVTVIAWFAILVTGRYSRGMFEFVVGVLRWGQRVSGYAFLLVTDRYPPFSLH